MRGSWDRLNRAEAALIADSAWLPDRAAHPVVIAVTTSARGGVSWLVACGLEALRRGGDRHFAARTAAAVTVALGASHLVKQLVPRRPRPEPPGGPARRDLPERPESSSFPSSHAAGAAAFATAVLTHDRRAGVLLGPVAVVAVYGRLRTRVHWPSDVVAGTAIGVAVGLGFRA